ncbi:MAG: glycosyltransferase [Bacteroidota bacterium]|nr:glycosyltransferase [Bacteroidota bacterium]
MISNRDIIIVGIQAWDIEIGSNCKNIAIEFAKNNRVLYVNQALDRITQIKNKNNPKVKKRIDVIKKKSVRIDKIDENLWNLNTDILVESINWLPHNILYKKLNKRNNKLFAKAIEKAIEKLDFKNYIIFNDSLMFLGQYLKEELKPEKYIYYIRDNLITQSYFKKHGKYLEPLLFEKSDLVVSNSTYLANYAKKYNKHSYMVGQGCDVSLFNDDIHNYAIPNDISNIGKPIIAYVGFLTSIRLDIKLLINIAKRKPDWNIVLVGPEDDDFKNSDLHNIKNVIFLGSKPPETLPAYIKAFDVCINPQVINDLTIGNYPRKIDEYLAMGKPVVATKTEAMDYFKEYAFLANNTDEYIDFINEGINNNSQDMQKNRKKFANNHTWENNVKEIYKFIDYC